MAAELPGLEALRLPGAPQVNPRQPEWVVLARSRIDAEKDSYPSELILLNLKSGEQAVLQDQTTGEPYGGHSPKWSEDGEKIAFLSNQNGVNELWLYRFAAGTAQCLVPGVQVKDYAWSPQGDKIAYITREQNRDSVCFQVRRLRYKLDGEGIPNGFDHVYLVDVETAKLTRISTAASDHRCPVFSADGRRLAYVVEFSDGDDLEKQPQIEIADLAQGQRSSLSPGAKSISALLWVNDKFYGAGKKTTENSVEFDKLFVFEERKGLRWLAVNLDVPVGYWVLSDVRRTGLNAAVQISEDERQIFFAGTREGRQLVFRLRLDTLECREVPLAANVIAFDLISCEEKGCEIVYLADSFKQPAEVYTGFWDLQNSVRPEQLTRWNDNPVLVWPEVEIKAYAYTSQDQIITRGWTMTPRSPGSKPVLGSVLVIHGGPHLSFGDTFFYDFLYLCSLGFRVIFGNPRGSSGYGQSFSRAIVGEWGNKDAGDVLGFLDTVGREEKITGPLFLMGGSYGGYLVNWLIAHDHRFQAAISERTVCNLYSKFGNSDLGFSINKAELGGGELWTDEELLMERSPIRYAPQVSTPVLLLHGENDQRCPIEQSEQWFNALRRLGKEVEFIRFPGASHAMAATGRPQQRRARLKAIADWLESH
ncbi:Acylaminoacyl-peptidase [Syntrophobotulus glycolicus DSM 8271]|uniref:Acylaminoacyl-peptidase n=2 Tax=Syntrophobotulus TaxID=51196 RepID=F0SWJ5_SYNGF|nr:Acylaminoacyl-peptidase [Syntrophobotulus glycolicus DSM 8271]